MALTPGNARYLAFAPQADKDTPETIPTAAVFVEDSSVDPGIQEINTSESDRSAQQGQRIRVGIEPGGTFRKYARPSEEAFFISALLGGNSGDDYFIDPAAPFFTPYLTVWEVIPGEKVAQLVGARVSQGTWSGAPGGAVDAEYGLVALDAHWLDDEPDVDALLVADDELPFTWPEYTCEIDGSDPHTVNSFNLVVNRGTSRFPGDNGFKSFDVVNGLVSVGGSGIELAFESQDFEREAATGSPTGTDMSTEIPEKSLAFQLTRGSQSIRWAIAAAQLTNVRTPLRLDASPLVTTFDYQSKRQADISDVVIVTVT